MAAKNDLQLDDLIRRRLRESGNAFHLLCADDRRIQVVRQIAQAVITALRRHGRILLMGNGGSAADAQHFAGELVGGYTNHKRPALDVIALSTNSTNLTAISNDYAFEEVFSRQVQAHARRGDLVIGISTSGNSANVIEGIRAANKIGALTVGLTGRSGGRLKKTARIVFDAPSESTPRIQEMHIAVIHSVCELVEEALFGALRQRNVKSET